MGLIKVESFDVDVANASTHTLTTAVDATSSAFIRRPGPSDKASGGPIGNTGNANPVDVYIGMALTATDTITFYAGSATSRKVMGEVWYFSGSDTNDDAFVNRGNQAVVVTSGRGSATLTGVVDRNRCVPFITGVSTTGTNTSAYDTSIFSAHIDSSGDLIISGSTGGTGTVYVDVVEFTGSNWTVGHAISSPGNHDGANPVLTLNTDSTGTGGSTFSSSITNTILEASMAGDQGGETGLSDVLFTVLQDTTQSVEFRLETDGDGGAQNDNVAYVHAFANPNVSVTRGSIVSISEGNNTYGTAAFPAGAPTSAPIDEIALDWWVDTTGVGTAHARGRLNARIISASGTIDHWVHRSGNDVDVQYGVIDLRNADGLIKPVISTLSIGNIPLGGATNITMTGANFGSTQGIGYVLISDNTAFEAGTYTTQSIDSWSDTSIQFDTVLTGLSEGQTVYVWVVSDGGVAAGSGFSIYYGNAPYAEVVENNLVTAPDHYITFHNTYVATLGGIDAETRTGSPTLTGSAITRASNGSIFYGSSTDGGRMNDSGFMNLNAETTRQLMLWFRLTELPTSPVVLYEEGGSVNNWCLFVSPGGIVVAQLGDSGDDNVHSYSDVAIDINRTYCAVWNFDYTEAVAADRLHKLYMDGVLQSVSFGNPLTSAGGHHDAHSGDMSFNISETALDVFSTDVTFPGGVGFHSDFASWRSISSESEIRETLFELGVIGDIIISSSTEAGMQAQLDVYTSSVQPNSDCTFAIAACDDGSFELNFDNITFNDNTSIHLQYRGADTLTVINSNGSNITGSKVSTPYGGTVDIQTPATVTITGLVSGSEVRVFNAGTTTEIGGIETSGTSFALSVQTSSIDISVLSLAYQNTRLKAVAISGDTTVPVVQRVDRQYFNP